MSSDTSNPSNIPTTENHPVKKENVVGHKSPYSSFYGSSSESNNINYNNPNSQWPPNNYNSNQPHQYNYPNQVTNQMAQPVQSNMQQYSVPNQSVPLTNQINAQPNQPIKPFAALVPTLESVSKQSQNPLQSVSAIPNSNPFLDQNAQNIQNQMTSTFIELEKLKRRYHKIVHRNPDILPDTMRSPFKMLSFTRSCTFISLFVYFAFRTNYMMSSGTDKRAVMLRCMNFFMAYMLASFGFNILETRQLERAFQYQYGAMSIPLIDEELKKLSEVSPILRY